MSCLEVACESSNCLLVFVDNNVADKAQEQLIRDLKVEYFETLDEAYARARELKGPDATLACIPNGVSVVVKD